MTTKDMWDHSEEMADRHANSGGIFIRLAGDGDKVVGAFCGEPYPREVHWTGEKYVECEGEACEHCKPGKRPSLRVMLNFFVPAEGEMKVIEGGTVWFNDVLKVRRKYGLDNWLFEIERHGEAGDPKTTYSILPEEKIDGELRAQIEAVDLHDLEGIGSGEDEEEAGGQAVADGPVDAETAGKLVSRLKALPRAAVDTFLEQFGVQRVRDLRAADVTAARQLLGGLEAQARKKAAPAQAEVDPFA